MFFLDQQFSESARVLQVKQNFFVTKHAYRCCFFSRKGHWGNSVHSLVEESSGFCVNEKLEKWTNHNSGKGSKDQKRIANYIIQVVF